MRIDFDGDTPETSWALRGTSTDVTGCMYEETNDAFVVTSAHAA